MTGRLVIAATVAIAVAVASAPSPTDGPATICNESTCWEREQVIPGCVQLNVPNRIMVLPGTDPLVCATSDLLYTDHVPVWAWNDPEVRIP